MLNLLPTDSNDGKSLYEVFYRGINIPEEAIKPYIKYLRTYFYNAYYFIKLQNRKAGEKFLPRARKAKLIRYSDLYSYIYTLWN